jgi:hypothetical protein
MPFPAVRRGCEDGTEWDPETRECVPVTAPLQLLGAAECEIAAVPGIGKTTPGFRRALVALAERLGVEVDWIVTVMSIESGFDPAIQNPSTRATGLIQIMPNEAVRLGTTIDALKAMTAEAQLEYVEKYYRQFKRTPQNLCEQYLLNFAPACIGKDPSFAVYRGDHPRCKSQGGDGRCAYDLNRPLDVDDSGNIECGDICQKIEAQYAKAQGRVLACDGDGMPRNPASTSTSPWPLVAVVGGAVALVWWLL